MQSGHVLDLGKIFNSSAPVSRRAARTVRRSPRRGQRGLHERGDAVLPRAAEIFHIHLRERARGQLTARDSKALAGSEHPPRSTRQVIARASRTRRGERAVVEQQFVAVLQISGQDRRDGKGFAERERIALAQRQRREKRADAQLRALQVDEQLTGNALRGLGAAQAFQPRRTLGEGTVGRFKRTPRIPARSRARSVSVSAQAGPSVP